MEFQINNFVKREKRKIIFGGEYGFLTKIFASDNLHIVTKNWKYYNLVFQNKDWKIIDRDLWLQGSRPPAKAACNTEDIYTITSCMAIPVLLAWIMPDAGLQPVNGGFFRYPEIVGVFVTHQIRRNFRLCPSNDAADTSEGSGVSNWGGCKASLLAWANDFQPYTILPGNRKWMHLKYNCK